MNNKEKAEEISKKYGIKYDTITKEGNIIEMNKKFECYNSALEMAEWKDEQFKQYLLQKRDGLKWRSDHIGRVHGVCEELMDEIIKGLGL